MEMASLMIRFRRDPIQSIILMAVIFLHFSFLLVMLISPSFAFHKKERKPLIVKMIVSKTAAKTSINNSVAASKSTPKPAQAPKKQEMPKTQISSKKETAPSKPSAQKTAPTTKKEPAIADKHLGKNKQPLAKKNPPPQNRAKISDSLLQELEESIAKIENKSDKGVTRKIAPVGSKTFAPILLQIDIPSVELSDAEDGRSDYTDTLVSHLHQCLSLPDYGEVKIQLSLRQDGTVAKVVVLKTQSEKNKQYLESNLPRLKFPRFDGAYASKRECTFTLTFCNEM
jgi:outer membrane biosynthesis protein TonB